MSRWVDYRDGPLGGYPVDCSGDTCLTVPQPCASEERSDCSVLVNAPTDWLPIVLYGTGGTLLTVFVLAWLEKCYVTWRYPKCVSTQGSQRRRSSALQESLLAASGGDVSDSTTNGHHASAMNADEVLLDDGAMRVVGYTRSWLGAGAMLSLQLLTLALLGTYVLLLCDYYWGCQFTGPDAACFVGDNRIFGSYRVNSEILFGLWWFGLVYFGVLIFFKERVPNWCRLRSPLTSATCVHVWVVDNDENLLVNPSKPVAVVMALQAAFRRCTRPSSAGAGDDDDRGGHEATVPVRSSAGDQGERYFIFECRKYLIGPSGGIVRAQVVVGPTFRDFHEQAKAGLNSTQIRDRLAMIGPNQIPYEVDTITEAATKEFMTFFYLYQLMSYTIWLWFSYMVMALTLITIVLAAGIINIYLSIVNQLSIKRLTEYVTPVQVRRNGSTNWVTINSTELVPGDVVLVEGNNWVLPCDMAIISGSAVCDESGLTGESMPVRKTELPSDQSVAAQVYNAHSHSRHTLFAGTTVLQAGSDSSEVVVAVVTQTSVYTSKGELISTILFPAPMNFKYDLELPIAFALLFLFAIVCFVLSVVFQYLNGATSSWVTKWVYGMVTLGQIVSPLIPVVLVIGQQQATRRLTQQGIFCINPKRIAISGKVRVFCFDKTGTLTKQGLDFLGFFPADESSLVGLDESKITGKETPDTSDVNVSVEVGHAALDNGTLNRDRPYPEVVNHGLCSCHAVSRYGDELVGNQVEVKMFSSTGWTLIEEPGQAPIVKDPKSGDELQIEKRFEFDHSRMTMSVLVRTPSGDVVCYTKGAAERVKARCDPATVGVDYDTVTSKHATMGCYVLALGTRNLGKLTSDDIADLTQDAVETDLHLLGVLLFRNELKPDTTNAIAVLKGGDVRPVMITGDNAQCGYYIARRCGMLDKTSDVLLGDVVDGKLQWSVMGAEETVWSEMNTQALLSKCTSSKLPNAELAVTGKAFDFLKRSPDDLDNLLLHIRVFARTSPQQKVDAVRLHVDRGFITGMCGDGGNDCGALRAAHVGVALSEAEASIVSPFTSKRKSVESVVELLREGRCALVTSFAGYKFLITEGLIFSYTKLVTYYYGVIMCTTAYLLIEGFIVIVISYAMTLATPLTTLPPRRPTSSLLGGTTIASVCGFNAINVAVMSLALLLMERQPEYIKFPTGSVVDTSQWWLLGDAWETTIMFSCFATPFLTASVVFSFGDVFRKPVYHNWLLCGAYAALWGIMTYLLLFPLPGGDPTVVHAIFHIASIQFNSAATASPVWRNYQDLDGGAPSPAMPFRFRVILWILVQVGIVLACLWEKLVVQGPVRSACLRRYGGAARNPRTVIPRL